MTAQYAATPSTARLARRLERYRAANPGPGTVADPLPYRPSASRDLARRLADAVDGEIVDSADGVHVRIERPSVELPVDRHRLARLPGQPPSDRPLVCLDTETTGLATAAGTLAFLIGLGWWTGTSFRQVQLLLPDQGEEPVLLEALARHIPADAWLVTYNGRGFDWPLLVTRYRMSRRAAPEVAGHLDLLPHVRRLFRHRMDDARLGTVERMLLGVTRIDDVDGWEIPGRYLGFLRGGPAQPLAAVVRHNDEDVRSLGRLLAHVEQRLGDRQARASAPRGDLAGLAEGAARLEEEVRTDAGAVPPAVTVEDVGDDLVAHLPVEVEVDVGQVGPAQVQKTLHRQVEAERIDVGDLQQVADERVAGRAAQRHRVPPVAGVAGDVADDQEVAGQIGRLDHRQFLAQALARGRVVAPAAPPQPALA